MQISYHINTNKRRKIKWLWIIHRQDKVSDLIGYKNAKGITIYSYQRFHGVIPIERKESYSLAENKDVKEIMSAFKRRFLQ